MGGLRGAHINFISPKAPVSPAILPLSHSLPHFSCYIPFHTNSATLSLSYSLSHYPCRIPCHINSATVSLSYSWSRCLCHIPCYCPCYPDTLTLPSLPASFPTNNPFQFPSHPPCHNIMLSYPLFDYTLPAKLTLLP